MSKTHAYILITLVGLTLLVQLWGEVIRPELVAWQVSNAMDEATGQTCDLKTTDLTYYREHCQ